MAILHSARELGLPAQVNTTVARHNLHQLADMVPFVEEVGAVQWSVFFLVPTGRAQRAQMITPQETEHTLRWLSELVEQAPFDVKVTAAPMYRRVVVQRDGHAHPTRLRGAGYAYGDGLNRPAKGVNDGRGFLFISHLGDITPSGFLPIATGNVRRDDIVSVYRDHPVFRELRNPLLLKGKCGACPFRDICGGQRGRAWALTGDHLESDPACAYVPEGWTAA